MKNNSKKKIAILYSGGRFFGGIEQYLMNLLKNIDSTVFEVELLSMGKWSLTDRLEKEGFSVKYFSEKRINPMTIIRVGFYLKKNKFDLLVSQGVVSNFYARKISFVFRVPNLVTVHSDINGDYANFLTRFLFVSSDRLMRFITRRYLTVSKFLKQKMIDSGIAGKKIDVVYNGIEFPDVKPVFHKGIEIGSAGRLHHVKGFDILIRAFAKIERDDIMLKIAGEGEELDNLKKLASNLGVGDRVKFVGFQKNIFEFLNTLDVYVQSSIVEGFGLSVAEAMSQELLVVVTPAGSLAEIVQDNKTGFVCKDFSVESLSAQIQKAVCDYNSFGNIRKNARRFVKINFDVKFWAENTKRAFLEAMK